ncbi:hypothetical protein [Novosphingobium sp.]|uniref:hypothetical protein n=1 Tax=Novosphingobium sp. TaxID=1874826 RepID=UPI002FDCC13C
MTQLVFVHGVATRQTPAYAADVALRDERFRKLALGEGAGIRNPFWGDLGAAFAFKEQCLPRNGEVPTSFSLGDSGAAAASTTGGATIAEIAAADFPAAVDTLYAVLVETAAAQNRQLDAGEYAEMQAAAAYAEANPVPAWVASDMTDAAFVDALRARLQLETPAAYGLLDRLKAAAGAVFDRGRNLVSSGVLGLTRDKINPAAAKFIGDVFVYLRAGAARADIRQRVVTDLLAARAEATANAEPLVVIGHSLGGVILYDLLTDPAGAGLPQGFAIDVLLTVGSQPGFFEELKLFAASDGAIPSPAHPLAAKPAAVAHWWNVYDPVDVLSFRCEGIFEEVEDFMFSSMTGVIDAHTSYFLRPRFFERLRSRLQAVA